MYIKKLVIRNQKEEKNIREIDFKPGVNLIVDISEITNLQDTGNDVGKTTVLRLINYCLGGKADEIYKNKESKNSINSTVKNFLINKEVLIILTLCKNFNNPAADIVVQRNFLKGKKKKICTINNYSFLNIEDFKRKLKSIFYNSDLDKPSFRQLIGRHLRFDYSSERIVNYLHFGTSDKEYEQIYLFLYGLDKASKLSIDKSGELSRFKEYENIKKKLFKHRTNSIVEQELFIINNDIEKIENKKNDFNINKLYQEELEEIDDLNDKINCLMQEYSYLKTQLKIYEQNILNIESERYELEVKDVETLYNEAGIYLPTLNKTLEETIEFHNRLVVNKVNFIKSDIPTLKTKILELKDKINEQTERKKHLEQEQKRHGSLSEYESLVSNINPLYEQRGKLLQEQEKILEYDSLIDECDKKIVAVNDEIQKYDKELQTKLSIFNKYFSEYAMKFYNESYCISSLVSEKTKCYKFELSNLNGNIGTGKKKGVMSAYDLAYISFANELKLQRPKFVLHDRIEDIHSNQLVSLISLVNSNNFDGQYIVSVLSGKFKEGHLKTLLEQNKVIELSPQEKLFKIEQQFQQQNQSEKVDKVN